MGEEIDSRLLRPSRGTSDGPAFSIGPGLFQARAWLHGEAGSLCFVPGKGLYFEPQQVCLAYSAGVRHSRQGGFLFHKLLVDSSCRRLPDP